MPQKKQRVRRRHGGRTISSRPPKPRLPCTRYPPFTHDGEQEFMWLDFAPADVTPLNLAWLVSHEFLPLPRGWTVHAVSRFDAALVLTRPCSDDDDSDNDDSDDDSDARE